MKNTILKYFGATVGSYGRSFGATRGSLRATMGYLAAAVSTFISYAIYFTLLFFLFYSVAIIDFQVPVASSCQGAEEATLDNNY